MAPPLRTLAARASGENPDHEMLARLAHDDPAAFEALRRKMLDELIGRAPDHVQRRLRGLQFRVDQVRKLAHTPLGAAIRISDLMWTSFLLLNRELSGVSGLSGSRANDSPRESPPEARIIDFRPRAAPGSN